MGYYTSYELTQERNPVSAATLANIITSSENMNYALNDDGTTCQSTKWYEFDKDMLAVSAKYPSTLFKLHGEGEESGDIWDKYYCGGKVAFEAKLKPELPKPDYDAIVLETHASMKRYSFPVIIYVEAGSQKESEELALNKLHASGIEFEVQP